MPVYSTVFLQHLYRYVGAVVRCQHMATAPSVLQLVTDGLCLITLMHRICLISQCLV